MVIVMQMFKYQKEESIITKIKKEFLSPYDLTEKNILKEKIVTEVSTGPNCLK